MNESPESRKPALSAAQLFLKSVVSDNLVRIWKAHADRSGKASTMHSWAAKMKLSRKIVERAKGDRGLTLVTVADIADKAGMEPWQLLVPDLDPLHPPSLGATQTPSAADLATTLDRISDPVIRQSAYATALRVLETAELASKAIEASRPG